MLIIESIAIVQMREYETKKDNENTKDVLYMFK